MTDYIPTHGVLDSVPYGQITLPIPASGSFGSLAITTLKPVQFRAGSRLRVSTGGTAYIYYATADLLTGYASTNSIAVTPEIQTVHASADFVSIDNVLNSVPHEMNVIGSVNCNSVDVTAPAVRRTVMPYVRAWPWTADPYGLSWDESNIMALMVKPITSAVDFNDATAGQPWNIPVPRTIGTEYTSFSTRSLGITYGYYRSGATAPVGPTIADYDVDFPNEYRDKDSSRSRSATLTYERMQWQPKAQYFTFEVADPDDSVNAYADFPASPATYYDPAHLWDAIRMSGDRPLSLFPPSRPGGGYEAYGVGCRGGRYSFCVGEIGLGMGAYSVDVEIRADVPGLGDILIHSVTCMTGPGHPGTKWGSVYTGTWAGVVVPTALSGTCARFYLRASTDCHLTYNSNVVIAASTQVPWGHGVITGNLVAPGGLIAPYY